MELSDRVRLIVRVEGVTEIYSSRFCPPVEILNSIEYNLSFDDLECVLRKQYGPGLVLTSGWHNRIKNQKDLKAQENGTVWATRE